MVSTVHSKEYVLAYLADKPTITIGFWASGAAPFIAVEDIYEAGIIGGSNSIK